jgi:hypothetical protein
MGKAVENIPVPGKKVSSQEQVITLIISQK